MFLGKHQHILDSKGRLAVPARFRDALGDGSVLTRGADKCLVIYPATVWRTLCERVTQLPLSDLDARTYRRFLFADALEMELDAQGRTVIPAELRAYADIDRSVVLIGMDSVIELWSDVIWARISRTLDDQADEIVGRLASMI